MARHYENTDTRRRQVAEAALRTIAEDGVSRFTTRAIASRVGISDGTLFRHFGNKEEIVLEAMSVLEEQIVAGLFDTGTAASDLEAFFRHRAAFVGAEGSVGRLIFSDGLTHLAGEVGLERVNQWRARSVAFLVDRLGRLQAQGQLRTDLSVPDQSMVIQGILLGFAMQATLGRGGDEAQLQQRIEHAWATVQALLFL